MNPKSSWLINAFVLDGKGDAKSLTEKEVLSAKPVAGLQWINLDLKKYQTLTWLNKKAHLAPWVSEILTDTQESRPRALFDKDNLLLVLRTVASGRSQDPDEMTVLRLWLTPDKIITVQSVPIESLQTIARDFHHHEGPQNGTQLLDSILDCVLLDISRSVATMEYEMDDLEEEIIDRMEDRQTLPELAELQRQLVGVRRYLAPCKEAFESLTRGKTTWFDENMTHIAQESLHRMQRILEDVDLLRERARINQEVLQANSVKQNQRNMYMLSVVATLFLPLSFLTGLLGMNVGGIPFATHNFGLPIMTLIIFTVGFLLIFVFKKLRWM